MRKLKRGDCAVTRTGQPVCNIGGRYRFVKKASAKGKQALRGIAGAASALAGKGRRKKRKKGKAKGKGIRAGVPTGYALMKSHRKGSAVPKGKCFSSKGRLWCRMKGTGRVKQMKTT